ncbi:unnamed protein product [Peniophora sp. CBMAI 1063]|nr:unnamed protein product [Peniophora sp. CBMAI 1063]
MSELPHGASPPLSTYAYITFQLPPPSPSSLPNTVNDSTNMGPTRSSNRSTRRQQASRRGRTQRGSPPPQTMQLPPGYTAQNLIPEPGIAERTPRPPRKSHARRQPAGHVPRPRNAFIIFRCDFVAARLIPAHTENNHRNISRYAGFVWSQLSTAQRTPWTTRADEEKRRHKARYPDYRYNPGSSTDDSSPSAAAGHSVSQTSSPGGDYIVMSPLPFELSASPAAYHEAQHLQTPGQRPHSAPPDAGVNEPELHMPQPAHFPLPVAFFSEPSPGAAATVVNHHAPSPAYLGTAAAPTLAQHDGFVGAPSTMYQTVPVTPYAYDWRAANTDDPALRRYHEAMQHYTLYAPPETDKKPTEEELAAASYERAASTTDFLAPSPYALELEPFLPHAHYAPYHSSLDLPYGPQGDEFWAGTVYTPYTAESSGSAHSGYAAYSPPSPDSTTLGSATLVEDLDPCLVTSTQTYESQKGIVLPWVPSMI